MGTVSRLRPVAGPDVAEAIDGFQATLDHPETAGTCRVYASTLRQLRAHLGPAAPLAVLDEPAAAAALVAWFTAQWGKRAPATFNRNLDTLRSAIGY
jgi:integrase/recombinase XerC/integrase/recombinase XerD